MARILTTIALLAISTLAAFFGGKVGLPLPFLLGPLIVTAVIAVARPRPMPRDYAFPQWIRLIFITVIGVMIGAQVTPDLFADAPLLLISFAALGVFVLLAHGWNYAVFRHLGGYDRVTAFFASAPGGLYESIALGEEAGADLPRLMLQQFLRIIVVVSALPIGLSLWLGTPVGSAAGLSLAARTVPWADLPVIVLTGIAGYGIGRVLRMPAAQLTGPMAAAAAVSLSGLAPMGVPQWMVNEAQIVLGTALGMRFVGISPAMILRGAWMSVLSVGGMLVLAGIGALALRPVIGQDFDVLLISFAPGGVTEMALVALSLSANPAFVTLHHIFRILITVVALGLSAKWLRRRA